MTSSSCNVMAPEIFLRDFTVLSTWQISKIQDEKQP